MKISVKAKIIAFLIITSTIDTCLYEYHYEEKNPPIEYEVNSSLSKFKYSNGYVYVGTNEELNLIKNNINDEDILVAFDYYEGELMYSVIDSYLIDDKEIRNEVINIIFLYDETHPSSWKRTKISMRNEWAVHNSLANINYQFKRTRTVDFNNSDEIKYKSKLLSKYYQI